MAVSSLPRDWISTEFLRLLFQNLICEERSDIRNATLSAWRTASSIMANTPGQMTNAISGQLILDWYAVVMTPIGVAIDTSNFHYPTVTAAGGVAPERHNVDKNMLAQDLSLVTIEVTLKARVAVATALAYLIIFWPSQVRFFE